MFVYRITNTINGKVYIGLDGGSAENNKRWKKHCSSARSQSRAMIIHQAMHKHGIENFHYEILEHHTDYKSLQAAEINQIAMHRSNDFAFGYNRTRGGDDNWWYTASPDHKALAKVSIARGVSRFWKQLSENDRTILCKKRSDTQKTIYSDRRQHFMQQGKMALDSGDLLKKYKKAGAATARVLAKEFEVTDPTGNRYRITNLRKFCRENNLIVENMRAVSKGTSRTHLGWVCASIIEDKPIYHYFPEKRLTPIQWIFQSPFGDTVVVYNLKQHCKEYELPYWSLTHLNEITKREWKGWKLLDRIY